MLPVNCAVILTIKNLLLLIFVNIILIPMLLHVLHGTLLRDFGTFYDFIKRLWNAYHPLKSKVKKPNTKRTKADPVAKRLP